MNLHKLFCPNIDCPARGQTDEGNIHVHSIVEKRCRCDVCHQTFSTTKGTLFYRLRTDPKTVMLVLVLLAYGCPVSAIVAGFGFDPRTIAKWWQRAGSQCEAVHNHVIGQSKLDLQQAQADEIKVKAWGRSLWMGLSLMVSTRLWLGGTIRASRNQEMINSVIRSIRQVALARPLLIAVDGLPHYIKAIKRAFRTPVSLGYGKHGRPRFHAWPAVYIGRVIKRKVAGDLIIERQIVAGCDTVIAALIEASQKRSGVLNTAYIERLNSTFRQRLSWLTRRSRVLAHQTATLTAGMYIVGCCYNFCDAHQSLRIRLAYGSYEHRWIQRTPAIAAGLADHIWSHEELFLFRVPLPRWRPPKRQGRRSKKLESLIKRWC